VEINSKIVFSGLGADEVSGGYARYKNAFEKPKEGEFSVEDQVISMEREMSLDLDRLMDTKLLQR